MNFKKKIKKNLQNISLKRSFPITVHANQEVDMSSVHTHFFTIILLNLMYLFILNR